MSLLWVRATIDPTIETFDSCSCGCGCEPDGDWHWSQQPWCRCVANACDCVTDHARKTSSRQHPSEESVQHILDNYCFDDAWPEHQHTPGRKAWESVKANYDLDHPHWNGLREDIRANGIQKPIGIDYEEDPPRIRNGHTRLLMAEQLGMEKVPVKNLDKFDAHDDINSDRDDD